MTFIAFGKMAPNLAIATPMCISDSIDRDLVWDIVTRNINTQSPLYTHTQ